MVRLLRLLGLLFPIRFLISVRVPFVLLSSYFLPICFFDYQGMELPRSSLVAAKDITKIEAKPGGQNSSLEAKEDAHARDGLEAFGDSENLASGEEFFRDNLLIGNLSMEEWLGVGVEKFNNELNLLVQNFSRLSVGNVP